jgi:hypothetical protein
MFCRVFRAVDGAAGCGIKEAKLLTVVRIKLTPAVTLAASVGSQAGFD